MVDNSVEICGIIIYDFKDLGCPAIFSLAYDLQVMSLTSYRANAPVRGAVSVRKKSRCSLWARTRYFGT